MSRQLKYDQARLAILTVIAQDQLKPGDRLPSVRQLLTRIPCSMITLRKSLELLENEDMLTRCIGKGTFLKRSIVTTAKNGKILFINVNRKNELSYPPAGSREYMQFYFSRFGLDFQYLQVECFSDEVLKASDHALGIMLYGWLTEDFLRSMKSLQIPLLTVGNSRRFPGIPQVELNIRLCAEMIAEQIIRKGAKSIFLLNSNPEYYMHDDISSGVRKAVRRYPDVRLTEKDLNPHNPPEHLRELIERYGNYDAWLFETGNYYTYLGTCRYYSLEPHPLVGIIGGSGHLESPFRYLIISSPDTVTAVFRKSLFEAASELLKEHIVSNADLKSVIIKPEIAENGLVAEPASSDSAADSIKGGQE